MICYHNGRFNQRNFIHDWPETNITYHCSHWIGRKQATVLVNIRTINRNLTPQKSVSSQQQRMKMHLNCGVRQNALHFNHKKSLPPCICINKVNGQPYRRLTKAQLKMTIVDREWGWQSSSGRVPRTFLPFT